MEEEHETARITEKQKATKYTHTIYINILYGKVELQEELFLS